MTNVSRVIGLISVSLAVAFVMHLVRLHVLRHQPQRSIFTGVFREGPIPIDTLYTEPESLFADPLHAPASGSNLMFRSSLSVSTKPQVVTKRRKTV